MKMFIHNSSPHVLFVAGPSSVHMRRRLFIVVHNKMFIIAEAKQQIFKGNFESNYAKPSYGMAFHSPANFLAVCVNYFLTIFSGGTFWVSHADHQCVTTE